MFVNLKFEPILMNDMLLSNNAQYVSIYHI